MSTILVRKIREGVPNLSGLSGLYTRKASGVLQANMASSMAIRAAGR